MKVLINDEIPLSKWGDLITKSCFSTPFQTHDFYLLFRRIPGYSALAIAVESNGTLQCLVNIILLKETGIKSYFTRRAIIYGGPVLLNDNRQALDFLLQQIKRLLYRKVIYTEFRNLNDYDNYKDIFSANKWEYQPYLNYRIYCTSENTVWQNLNNNRQRQIKKSVNKGIIIQEARSLTEFEEYYLLLKNLYQKKINKPLLNYDFFRLFFEMDLGKLLLVYFNDKIVGGILCPILKDNAIYEFYICGLDRENNSICPSVMATYAAIQYGLKNNLKYFDFMGAGKIGQNYGVRDFKEKFGGNLVEHGRFLMINETLLYKTGELTLKILKKLK